VIDDGVRAPFDGIDLLRRLHDVGFDVVVATPHMRPGMFENDQRALIEAFEAMRPHLASHGDLPEVHLASEHFFDDTVYARLVKGEGLPYPYLGPPPHLAKRGVLIELNPRGFPNQLAHRFFDLGRAGLFPVLAHPERYEPVWNDDACLEPLIDAGARLLLDVCALVGKYGRASQRAAEKLLDEDAYEAACSDAHRPDDADVTAKAIAVLEKRIGKDEAMRLLRDGPRDILGLPAST